MIVIYLEDGSYDVDYQDAGPEYAEAVMIIDKDHDGFPPEDLTPLGPTPNADMAFLHLYKFDSADIKPLSPDVAHALEHYYD